MSNELIAVVLLPPFSISFLLPLRDDNCFFFAFAFFLSRPNCFSSTAVPSVAACCLPRVYNRCLRFKLAHQRILYAKGHAVPCGRVSLLSVR
jgi:hypothetical protein